MWEPLEWTVKKLWLIEKRWIVGEYGEAVALAFLLVLIVALIALVMVLAYRLAICAWRMFVIRCIRPICEEVLHRVRLKRERERRESVRRHSAEAIKEAGIESYVPHLFNQKT